MAARRLLVSAAAVVAGIFAANPATAGPAPDPAGRGEIIVTAPGARGDRDAQAALDGAAIGAAGTPDLLQALARNVAGVSLQDAQGNPFQPELVYRGYTASPLQGRAQGLAFYVDGGRFNQPFGDTVDFDLLPDAAIATIAIEAANPAYGLNALGGAVVIETKTGRRFQGLSLAGAGGTYGSAEGVIEAGWRRGRWSGYGALQQRHDGGWRRHSPSSLYNGLADLGYDGADAGADLKLIGADTALTGNGTAPIELLAADPRAVFTYPDRTVNRFARISLHPWATLSATLRISGSVYRQYLRQTTVNGDAADIDRCGDGGDRLCLSDDADRPSPLLATGGSPIPALLGPGDPYGVLNRSETRSVAAGLLVQLVDRRSLAVGSNQLAIGASYDASRTAFRSASELGALGASRGVDGLGWIIDQPDGTIAPVALRARTRFAGLFADETLPLAPRLSLDLDLRYNQARILLDDRLGTALNGRHRFARLNAGGALAYRLAEALLLHAGYAETNRAPTPAELSCAGPHDPCSLTNFFVADPPLKQVVAKSWEATASGKFQLAGGRFDWRLAGYRARNQDDILSVAADVRGRAYFRNVGATRRQGFEASLGVARRRWSARLGYAFTAAEYRDRLVLNSPDNPAADAAGTIAIGPGARFPGVPRHRGVVALEHAGAGFSFGGDVEAQSGQYLAGDEANRQPKTRGFAIIGLHGSVALSGPFSAFAAITNLLDRHYATFGTFSETGAVALAEAPGATDPRSIGPGAPRRWTAGLKASF